MMDIDKADHFHFKSLDSTNIKAKSLIKDNNVPFIVTSDYQISGRGRLGKQWHSIAGGLYYSITIDANKYPFEIFHYPFLISLSVYSFLADHVTSGLHIKWPNDLLVNNKKIAGILIEKVNHMFIIGIGININQYPGQIDVKKKTISLAKICNNSFDVTKLSRDLTLKINSIFIQYRNYQQQIIEDTKSKYTNIGKQINCKVGKIDKSGTFLDLGEYGELLLETTDGIEHIFAADIIE